MKRDILIAVAIFLILTGSAVFKLYRTGLETKQPEAEVVSAGEGGVILDEGSIAAEIARQINSVSPTATFEEGGWIAERISFVRGLPQAFVEYTDTHIALRLLLDYTYQSEGLKFKVLATYLPQGNGTWKLQFGKDETAGRGLRSYVFASDAKQWIPEL